jgi:ABC-type lipoprotein release transport system permease subunit
MGAIRLWARVLLRNHWRTTLFLGLMCGLAAGAAGAGWATARRTADAFPAFVASHRPAAFGVVVCPAGQRLDARCSLAMPTAAQRDELQRVAGVDAVVRASAVVGRMSVHGQRELALVIALADRPLARPDGLLVAGRTAVPTRPGDLVINEIASKIYHLRAGDRITFTPYLEDQAGAADNAGVPNGPVVHGVVAGVVRQAADFTAGARGANQDSMAMYVPRDWWNQGATLYRYGAQSNVWLRSGADPATVKQGIREAVAPGSPAIYPSDVAGATTVFDAIDFEVWAARAFALVVALAALLLLSQAIARQVGRESDDASTLRSMGFTRRAFAFATGLRWCATAAVAALIAGLIVVMTSPIAPIGLARRTITQAHIHFDVIVVSVTMLGVALLVIVLGAFAGWRASAPNRQVRPVGPVRSVRALAPAAATGLRATLLGLRRPLRNNTGSAVGAIALVTMAAIAGVAVVTSYDRLLTEPARYGAPWDAVVGNNASVSDVDQTAAALAKVRGVGAVAGILDLDDTLIKHEKITLISFLPVRGQRATIGPKIVEGRAPTHAGEVALASITMRRLGVSIGDRVVMHVPNTPLGPLPARVVGRAVVNNTYGLEPGEGGVIASAWAKEEVPKAGFEPVPQQLAVKVADGASRATVLRDLRRTFPQSYGPPVPSTGLRNLGRLRGLPWVLVAMLFALAVGATLHALVTGIRRRRHELAILRSLGFTAGDTRSSLGWQIVTTSAIATGVGLVLGVAVARLAWRGIVHANGLESSTVIPIWPVAAVVALAIVVPLLLSIVPAVRESRRDLGAVLRVE